MQDAAEQVYSNSLVMVAAFDCSNSAKICKNAGVTTFPTFLHYAYGTQQGSYDGPLEASYIASFVDPSLDEL
jgi:hypothetical protein